MQKSIHVVGLDISSLDFAASISNSKLEMKTKHPFANSPDGFSDFESWLREQKVDKTNCVICLEATGVYAEQLCYWLRARAYTVALEQPLKVKRAFHLKGHKTDPVDSRQIAEYALRFSDKLNYWQPAEEVIEQLKVLLTTREQFVKQRTANKNMLKTLSLKVVQTPLANQSLEKSIENQDKAIADIEKEMRNLINKEQHFKEIVSFLSSIQSVGFLLAVNFLVMTQGFSNAMAINHRKAAAYVSICPYQHESGTSIYKKPSSYFMGPSRMRKLLYLASVCAIQHNKALKMYYHRKVAEGKPKKVVLNNIANKLLKIMCAIVRTEKQYIPNHRSIHPNFC